MTLAIIVCSIAIGIVLGLCFSSSFYIQHMNKKYNYRIANQWRVIFFITLCRYIILASITFLLLRSFLIHPILVFVTCLTVFWGIILTVWGRSYGSPKPGQ